MIIDNQFKHPDEDPLSPGFLFELSLFSTSIFVLAALLMQFLLTLQTAILLKIFSYPFLYSLFTIKYLSQSSTGWSSFLVFFVFASGPLILSVIGLRFLWALKDSSISSWKTSLILTWISFLLVNALPCAIIAGAFFFDGFGVAFHWMNNNYFTRILIALFVLLIVIFASRFWIFLFLKTSYTTAILSNSDNRRLYLKNVFFKPWLYGLIILGLFNWPFNSFYWPACLLSLGFFTRYSSKQLLVVPDLELTDSDITIFSSRRQGLYIVIGLIIIWFAGNLRINF